MHYTLGIDKFLKAINDFPYPASPPEEPMIDWDVPPTEIQRVTWSYASLANCTYEEVVDQLSYMTYADANEFLGEGY